MRRVVVTGLGVVSPIGTGLRRFFDALKAATPGVAAIRSFDATAFPTRIAAEVKDADLLGTPVPLQFEAALRRDRKSMFGILAGREALRHAFGGVVAAAALRTKTHRAV